jgi:hypothetical protein
MGLLLDADFSSKMEAEDIQKDASFRGSDSEER